MNRLNPKTNNLLDKIEYIYLHSNNYRLVNEAREDYVNLKINIEEILKLKQEILALENCIYEIESKYI